MPFSLTVHCLLLYYPSLVPDAKQYGMVNGIYQMTQTNADLMTLL